MGLPHGRIIISPRLFRCGLVVLAVHLIRMASAERATGDPYWACIAVVILRQHRVPAELQILWMPECRCGRSTRRPVC